MIDTTAPTARTTPPTASMRETISIATAILLPTLAKGVIIRRPWAVALAERLNLDTRAVRYAQRLRNKYGPGPLLLNLPPPIFRALILAPDHVRRVLNQSPEPFATASTEKRAALSHFEPKGVLISHGAERADRRRFNEAVLDTQRPAHRFADRFLRIVDEEAAHLLANVERRGELA